ncbi:MAG: hypothetical protein M1546_22510 [Chloroflexi bacterium]|nr:hypothetical protein [Chloroflexota bacterium]
MQQLQRWQRAIVLVHVVLAVLFGVIVPPWEAHDETGHFAYVNHLITTHNLPDAQTPKVFLDQSHQPPLYYLVVAGLTFWIDRSDQLAPQTNLFAFDGTNRRGTRILLRQRGEAFPWQGTLLALHAARLVSALLSGVMILFIARATRRLFADMPTAALLATAIAAFNPQVLFMAGMVNNDIMVSLTGAALALLVITINDQTIATSSPTGSPISNLQSRPVHWAAISPFLLLGITLALCLWSKNSSLILLPFTGLALLFIAWRQHWPFHQFITRGLQIAVPLVIIAVPLYVSNLARFGALLPDRSPDQPTQVSLLGAGLAVSLRDQWLQNVFVNAFRTFWGTFGWGNVQMPDAVYVALAIFSAIGLLGFVIGLRRACGGLRDGLVLLSLLGIAMLVLPGYRAIYYQSPALLPGRYLMPALAAYAGMLGFGWATFSLAPRALTLLAAAFAWLVPFAYIAPAYAPPPVTHDAAPRPALLTFEDVAQVTAVDATTTYLDDREGKRHYAHVRLTWRALKTPQTNYAFGISILGRDNEVLGNVNVHPARGNYPSTNWNPGDTFEDEYDVLLERPCPSLPALGRVSVSVYEYAQVDSEQNTIAISITRSLQALDGAGRPVAPLIGRFKIDAPAQPVPKFWQPPLAMLDGIALRDADLPRSVSAGALLTITLTYETWMGGNPEGTGFVHLFDAHGQPIAQDDHAALHGAYPTDLWTPGECVVDTFSVQVPVTATGNLTAVTGFYSPVDGTRFTTGTPDNLVPLGSMTVTAALENQ